MACEDTLWHVKKEMYILTTCKYCKRALFQGRLLVPLSRALCDTPVYHSAIMRVRIMDLKGADSLLKLYVSERENNPDAEEKVPIFISS